MTRNSSLTPSIPLPVNGESFSIQTSGRCGNDQMSSRYWFAHAPMISGGSSHVGRERTLRVRSSSASQSIRPVRRASVTTRQFLVIVERVGEARRWARTN